MSKVVLGGGLSGLSAAYYLSKKVPPHSITLAESSNRLGGWVKSTVYDDGIVFEQGPRTLRPFGVQGINTLSLIEDLKLNNEILPILSRHPAAKNRMIYTNGELHLLPSTFLSLFKKQSPFSKPLVWFLAQDIFMPKKAIQDDSIYNFVKRRFGEEVADYLISAMVCGICGGDSKEISVNFLMKGLFDYEQKYGSISVGLARNLFKARKKPELKGLSLRAHKEKWSVYSLRNGLETLPKSLENHIVKQNVDIKLNSKCSALEINDSHTILHFENQQYVKADHIFSSISAESLANLLKHQHPDLSQMLSKIKNVTIGVVNLHYDKLLLTKEGFGFLVPPKEKLPILGVIYDSCCFPHGDSTVLTVMMGGCWFEELFGKHCQDAVLLETAKAQLKDTLGITDEPVKVKVNILKKCISQYVVGHNENLDKINNYIRQNKLPLSLCGASYYGVGVNDVILSAKNAVERLLKNT